MDEVSGQQRWVLLGAGGHASSIAAILQRRGDVVAGISGVGDATAWIGAPRFAHDSDALTWAATHGAPVAIAVGDGAVRERLLRTAADAGVPTPPVVAASAVVSPHAVIGHGSVVGELAFLGPGVTVGAAAIVNTAAVVEHDARVGDLSHVAPRALLLGGARVGTRCLVGGGAVILPERVVADGCTVGAGSVVTVDVVEGATVVGVPAHPRDDPGERR